MPYSDPLKQRAYQREFMRRRRSEFFANKACAICGETSSLDLDHIDPAAKVSHRIWSWSRDRREAELAKCQVLCGKHHQEKTNEDNGFFLKHGTVTGYNEYRCRCRPCTDAAVKSVDRYRRLRKQSTVV